MRKLLYLFLFAAIFVCGCNEQQGDPRVNLQPGVGSDSLAENIITRPIGNALSALMGEGVEVCEAKCFVNSNGFLEVQVRAYNKSAQKKDFEYKIEWLDNNGKYIDSITSNWNRISAMPKTEFYINGVATRPNAADFRINTRKR